MQYWRVGGKFESNDGHHEEWGVNGLGLFQLKHDMLHYTRSLGDQKQLHGHETNFTQYIEWKVILCWKLYPDSLYLSMIHTAWNSADEACWGILTFIEFSFKGCGGYTWRMVVQRGNPYGISEGCWGVALYGSPTHKTPPTRSERVRCTGRYSLPTAYPYPPNPYTKNCGVTCTCVFP